MAKNYSFSFVVALHNIPEGLAVGVAFGAIASRAFKCEIFSIGSAIALAIGIGIQNFPEGFAVSLPLRRQGMSKFKSCNGDSYCNC